MKLRKMSFATLATLALGCLTLADVSAYDPCERCYQQYQTCLNANNVPNSTCRRQFEACSQRYCN